MYCEVENNIIVNVVEVPNSKVAHELGLLELPEGKWIGDRFEDLPEPEPTHEYATKDDVQAVWDTLAAAYQKGVDEA